MASDDGMAERLRKAGEAQRNHGGGDGASSIYARTRTSDVTALAHTAIASEGTRNGDKALEELSNKLGKKQAKKLIADTMANAGGGSAARRLLRKFR